MDNSSDGRCHGGVDPRAALNDEDGGGRRDKGGGTIEVDIYICLVAAL